MNEQLTFDLPPRTLARGSDPDTSHAAAAANAQLKAGNRRTCLEAHLRYPEGLTYDEVSELTGISEHETGRRCADLRTLELIEWLRDEHDEIVTRKTRLGRAAGVCVPT